MLELSRPRMTIWRMRITCWIPKATNTHSGYTMLIAFSLQQWLHERTSMLLLNILYWSSVLAFSIQIRGFKPGRSRRIFKGEKILSTSFFGGEVKPSVPCRRFAARKRSLKGVEAAISAKLPDNILAHSSTFRH